MELEFNLGIKKANFIVVYEKANWRRNKEERFRDRQRYELKRRKVDLLVI